MGIFRLLGRCGGKGMSRGKKRLIESKTKYRQLKKSTRKGTLRQAFICLRPRTSYPLPSLHTVYVDTVYSTFT